MNPSGAPWRTAGLGLLLAVAIASAFAPALRSGFVDWDDPINLTQNPDFNPVSLAAIARVWRQPKNLMYIPATYTVWGAISAIAYAGPDRGLDPVDFHLANLLCHFAAALLVWNILRRLSGRTGAAWLGAALFALHPVQVEAVAWATGLKDVLGGLLSVAALWLYIGYAQSAPGSRSARWRFTAATAALVLAVLAKPSAAATPLLALLLDRYLLHRDWRQILWPMLLWLVLVIPPICIARAAQPIATGQSPSLWQRPLIAADALAFYLAKIAWPFPLGPDYGRSPRWLFSQGWPWLTWILPASLAGLALALRKKAPWLGVAMAVFFVALLSMLGLLPFDFQSYSTVADRYLYLAMLGPALALTFLLCRTGMTIRVLAGCAIATLAGLSFLQARTWHDSLTFFDHALEVNPDSDAMRDCLGELYTHSNQFARAAMEWRTVLANDPQDSQAQFHLAEVLAWKLGEPGESVEHFRAAIAQYPNDPKLYSELALVLDQLGRTDEADRCLRHAVELAPDDPRIHFNYAQFLRSHGQTAQARAQYQAALRLLPDLTEARTALEELQPALSSPTPAVH